MTFSFLPLILSAVWLSPLYLVQFLMVTILLKILCCLLSGEYALKFRSFGIESPSWFEPGLIFHVLFCPPIFNLGFCCAGFSKHALQFSLFTASFRVVCPSWPFARSKYYSFFRVPSILFIWEMAFRILFLNTIFCIVLSLNLARAKSMFEYVLEGKCYVHLV